MRASTTECMCQRRRTILPVLVTMMINGVSSGVGGRSGGCLSLPKHPSHRRRYSLPIPARTGQRAELPNEPPHLSPTPLSMVACSEAPALLHIGHTMGHPDGPLAGGESRQPDSKEAKTKSRWYRTRRPVCGRGL